MTERIFNTLFICTGNSARSIMAEAILNSIGQGRFKAYSAGSSPSGVVSSYALEIIERNNLPNEGLWSKSWNEFALPTAPAMDFVLTVCDKAAGEVCPVWPGQPMTAHWGVEDPLLFVGSEEQKTKVFMDAFRILHRRISLMTSLPFDKLSKLALQKEMDQIGLL